MSADDGTIEQAVRAWQVAWNTGDMAAVGRLFCDDADFVNVRGSHWQSRAEIESEHTRRHGMQLKDSIFTPLDVTYQHMGGDMALVHIKWSITGDHDLDGSSRSPRSGMMSWLMLRDADHQWRIRSAHNTHIAPER